MWYLFQRTLYVTGGFNMTSEYFLQCILALSHFPFIQFIVILLLVKRVRIWEIVQCKILLPSTSTLAVVSTKADCIKDWNCSFTGLGIFRKKMILSKFRLLFLCVLKAETHLEAHVDNLEKSYMPFVNTTGNVEGNCWEASIWLTLSRLSVNVSLKVIK